MNTLIKAWAYLSLLISASKRLEAARDECRYWISPVVEHEELPAVIRARPEEIIL